MSSAHLDLHIVSNHVIEEAADGAAIFLPHFPDGEEVTTFIKPH